MSLFVFTPERAERLCRFLEGSKLKVIRLKDQPWLVTDRGGAQVAATDYARVFTRNGELKCVVRSEKIHAGMEIW